MIGWKLLRSVHSFCIVQGLKSGNWQNLDVRIVGMVLNCETWHGESLSESLQLSSGVAEVGWLDPAAVSIAALKCLQYYQFFHA